MPKNYDKSVENQKNPGYRTPQMIIKKQINKRVNFSPKGFNPGMQKTQHRG